MLRRKIDIFVYEKKGKENRFFVREKSEKTRELKILLKYSELVKI
jgi:hypothetical protein